MMRKTTTLMVIFVVGISQTSCSFLFRVFIRNFTDKPVELRFQRDNHRSYQPDWKFGYKDDLVKINHETVTLLDRKATVTIAPTEVTLTISPKSTICIIPVLSSDTITLQSQFAKLGIENGRKGMLVQDGEVKDSLDVTNFSHERKFKRKGGLFVRTLYYYDYGRSNR